MTNNHTGLSATVIGSGNWGLAFSRVLIDSGTDATLYSNDKPVLEELEKTRTSKLFDDIKISRRLNIEFSLEKAIEDKDIIFIVTPSQTVRTVSNNLKPFLNETQILVCLSKGLEIGTEKRMSEVIYESTNHPKDNICVLSGPNLAGEIIRRQPTASVIACQNEETAKIVAKSCNSGYFKPFTSTDIIGVELLGDLKNVLAIICGMVRGYEFGYNSLSSIITRGMSEIISICKLFNIQNQTIMGLSGIGDLMTTCFSPRSRNNSLGFNIAKGNGVQEALDKSNGVSEGYYTVKSAYKISKDNNLDTPIINAIYEILYEDSDPYKTLENMILNEPIKSEITGL